MGYKLIEEKRTSHFCRNEKWRWYGFSLCSLCSEKHYTDGKILHLYLSKKEVDERNEKIRKEKTML